MRVTISSGLVEAIVVSTRTDPVREVCGLLLGGPGRIEGLVAAANVATDPTRRFEVDPKVLFNTLRAARAGGAQIVGCYHSHPSGGAVPSDIDRAMIGYAGEIWLICDGERVRAWQAATADSFVEVALVIETAACAAS